MLRLENVFRSTERRMIVAGTGNQTPVPTAFFFWLHFAFFQGKRGKLV
jgi:hypothetical protein